MNTKYLYIALAVVLFGAISYQSIKPKSQQSFSTPQEQSRNGMGMGQGNSFGQKGGGGYNNPVESRKNCLADGCLAIDDLNYPADKLTDTAKIALTKALDDEYKAQATYEAIISKLGNVRPFIMIIRAEEQHISMLKALHDKFGMEIPVNPYTGNIISPETLPDACTAGIEAEIANVSLYKNELLPSVIDYEDITMVFTNLMNASQEKHLVAFQRCAN